MADSPTSVLLGVVFLGERLRRGQGIAVALASVGVAILTVDAGTLPWVSGLIAVSFAGYGLFRKTVNAGPEVGLAVKTTLMLPVVLGWFLWRGPLTGGVASPAFAAADPGIKLLVTLSGPITLVSLVWFSHGARRLPLSTLGLLQYLAPTGQFLVAVFIFGETFAPLHLTAFAFIWTGLALFTFDLRRHLAAGRDSSYSNLISYSELIILNLIRANIPSTWPVPRALMGRTGIRPPRSSMRPSMSVD